MYTNLITGQVTRRPQAGQKVWVSVQNGGHLRGLVLEVFGTHIAWSPECSNEIFKVPLSYVRL